MKTQPHTTAEKMFGWRDVYDQDAIVGEKETVGDLLDWCIEYCNSVDYETVDKVNDARRALDERLMEHSLKRYEKDEVDEDFDDDGDEEDE